MTKPPEKKQDHLKIKIIQPRQKTSTEENLDREIGGQKGPEPTRYGDWEKGGRCSDF